MPSSRSSSPRFPRVEDGSANTTKEREDSAVSSLLKSSLTSLTLGSLGLSQYTSEADKLPKVYINGDYGVATT